MEMRLEWLERGQIFPLFQGRSMVIGRSSLAGAEIILDDIHINRRHSTIHWDGCRVWVHDLASTNGTYINGERFRDGDYVDEPEGHLLRLGDVLRPGPVRLRLQTSAHVKTAWLMWNEGIVFKMAEAIYRDGTVDQLGILADALEEAGCTDAGILNHCRQPGEHVRGCWVVDLLLGKS
jgi:FHA domain